MMNRTEILDEAKECVTGQREQDHGKAEDNFYLISRLWTEYTGHNISSSDVAIMMALLKIARVKTGHDLKDSFVDICGYAACAGELHDLHTW